MCTLVFFRIYEGKKYFAVTLGKKRANGVKEECEAVVIFSAGKRILYNAVPYAGKKRGSKRKICYGSDNFLLFIPPNYYYLFLPESEDGT